jgi:mono/diheme cytochrome c family protein
VKPRASRALAAAGALLLATGAGWWWTVRPLLTPAERGRRLAERTGCFACHGPEGSRGTPNPGRQDGAVPTFGSELMMFAADDREIREWIEFGVTTARAESETWREQRDAGALRMPAFGDRLSDSQIDDLVAFVRAVNGAPEPTDSLALAGRGAASRLGCFGCHGAGGRFARPNPGSLKGYVPAWDGRDFPDLVRSRAEFDEWVRDGRSVRFARNPAARLFLDRAALRMPAYRDHLQAGDLDALWAYARWLRSGS